VRVKGRDVVLYDHDPDERDLPATEDPWMGCTVMPAAAINRLLETAEVTVVSRCLAVTMASASSH
jgi:hypothetical protein